MTNPPPLYIFSDIETESFKALHVLQIAAITDKGDKFSIYINPGEPLPSSSLEVTGLYFHKQNLYRNGCILPSVSAKKGLRSFSAWLQSFNKTIHLVFHNAFAFDIMVLLRHFSKQKLPFPNCVLNIHDSLPACRKFIQIQEISGFKLGALAEHFKVPLLDAHNAIDDANCLKEVCEALVKAKDLKLSEFLNSYVKPITYFQAKLKPKK
jgi:DNA polymerase III epsilon subunit-like protein